MPFTRSSARDGAPAAWQSRVPAASDIDVFARVTGDQSNAAGKLVPAHGASLGADFVELWVNGSSRGRAAHPGWADNTGAWSATLPLDAGAQTLHARAAHPSGAYTATAASTFGVAVPLAAVTTVYDADGNVTSRSFADGRTQTLTWDAFGQLVKVAERDSAQNGHDWSAAYDAFGRRLRTVHQPVVAGAASGSATTILSLYDPAAEFLEIAVVVDGVPAWKVHGPDLDGTYGGWNGTGGLEAVLTPHPKDIGAWLVRAAASDGFGNIVAVVSGQGPSQKAEWLPTRVGGYGPLPNHRAQPLTSADHLVETLAWRTRRIDPTGFYWLGARYYEPTAGRFLSPDPFGHASDMSLYAFAHGDPVNSFDPDGRLATRNGINPYHGQWRDGFGVDLWGNFYGVAEGFGPPSGLTARLLEGGQLRDNRGDIADAYGRWQGAVDADAFGQRMVTFGAYLLVRAEGDFGPAGSLGLIGAVGPSPGRGNVALKLGSFSIRDWNGYPASIPKPAGPFRLLGGAEYNAARAEANAANRALHAADESLGGWQIHEVKPVKFSGSPTDIGNKIPLPAGAHSEVTNWWNTLMRDLTRNPGGG